MLKKWTVLLIMLLTFVGSVFAQETTTIETVSNQASPDIDVSLTDEGLVSLDFREADIKNVFKILSVKSGVNIVASPQVTGTVSIQLNDVPWQEALDVILDTYGYASERRGNIIVVTTVEDLKKRREDALLLADQAPVKTRTFTLNFGQASTVVNSLDKIKSDRGTIDFDSRTNIIIATDISSRLDLMEQIVKKLDATTPQVLIESKIVETTFVDTENLGVDWTIGGSMSGSSRGISWPFKVGTTDNPFAGTDSVDAVGNMSYGTLSFTQMSAVYEVLKSSDDTNILSAPRIVTLDNQPAQIIIGEQYPLPTYTYNEQQGKLQVSGWSYKDIGIIFDVTPHVNAAGFVTLEVEPKITAITGSVTVEGTSVPQLSNESARTTVMIKDKDTLVIGGLIKTTTSDTKKKIPFLGDVPIIGYAFKKSEESTTKKDMLIFITPHIITPEI